MSYKRSGGAAFPSPGVIVPGLDPNARQQGAYEGMTLRDYFAANALVGAFNARGFTDELTFAEKAEWVYLMADAML